MRLLLAEDEPGVASFVKRALEESGYSVTVAPDAPTAQQLLDTADFDGCLFDVMLPGGNGIELCKYARRQVPSRPVLLLTALGTTDNIVLGLDSGADDYLTKPFHIAELLARVRALLRRAEPAATPKSVLQFGEVTLDLNERNLSVGGSVQELTATEFRLLEYFLRNPRRVLSRMDLLEKVWGYDFNLNTKVVDVYINYLRRKLETGGALRIIHTVVGSGYILKEGRNADTD